MTSREEGFTLVELLVAMVIGMVIMLAGLQALDSFTASSATVTARTDNSQRARLHMDLLVRELRSQVCRGPASPSMLAGTDTSVSFVADFSDGTATPHKRTITYDPVKRRISEQRFAGTRDAAGVLTFAATGSAGPSLSNVSPIAGKPIFDFFAYDTATPPRPAAPLSGSLTATELPKVALVKVAFRVGPATAVGNASSSAALESDVFLRSVDPSDPSPVPRCF